MVRSQIEQQQYADTLSQGSTKVKVKQVKRRPLFLMRGVDRCGLNDFSAG